MQLAKLVHNPGAGDEETSGRELKSLLEANGYRYQYASTKEKGWEKLNPDIDFIVVAGGDGTVRKVAGEILHQQKWEKQLPLALLALGTANNIAKTLGIGDEPEQVVDGWKKKKHKLFDVGVLTGLPEPDFFIEGFGYGPFPRLMKDMKKLDRKGLDKPEKLMKKALKVLLEICQKAKPTYCRLQLDGTDYSGEYLLVEVMNIRSVGPNLVLAPGADPGDGYFEVVLVTESQQEELAEYVDSLLRGQESTFPVEAIQAREIQVCWDGKLLHADDELHETEEPADIRISMREGLLEFLLPG
jgi:diacylglycerol kinase (ATP)